MANNIKPPSNTTVFAQPPQSQPFLQSPYPSQLQPYLQSPYPQARYAQPIPQPYLQSPYPPQPSYSYPYPYSNGNQPVYPNSWAPYPSLQQQFQQLPPQPQQQYQKNFFATIEAHIFPKKNAFSILSLIASSEEVSDIYDKNIKEIINFDSAINVMIMQFTNRMAPGYYLESTNFVWPEFYKTAYNNAGPTKKKLNYGIMYSLQVILLMIG